MFIHQLARIFENHNVMVDGCKGSGKDLLFGNVIAYRKKHYASNLNYGGKFMSLDLSLLDCGGNTYDTLINNKVKRYISPYGEDCDIYLSDAGIYLPSQYFAELNKKYQGLSMFQAMTRQLNSSRFHVNTQSINRVFDKIREQSDIWIHCRKCIYIKGLVIQFITIYDKFESCLNRVRPCRIRVPRRDKVAKMNAMLYRDNYYNTYGDVKNRVLIYFNKSKHDTRYFKKLFENGVVENDNKT